uniref:Uncharacterized protein n=1 Tax=Arundo donax TaxID=35708 RepID=A0A0A8ZFS1_ARUDO
MVINKRGFIYRFIGNFLKRVVSSGSSHLAGKKLHLCYLG